MNIVKIQEHLMQQRIFKGKCYRQLNRFNQQGTEGAVELRKDMEALDYAIRLIGEQKRSNKK